MNEDLQKATRDLLVVCTPIIFIIQLHINPPAVKLFDVEIPFARLGPVAIVLTTYMFIKWCIAFAGNLVDWRSNVGFTAGMYRAGPQQTVPEVIKEQTDLLINEIGGLRHSMDRNDQDLSTLSVDISNLRHSVERIENLYNESIGRIKTIQMFDRISIPA